jgi:hypothetical protein
MVKQHARRTGEGDGHEAAAREFKVKVKAMD